MDRFPTGTTLTSTEAADLLGVHPSTVKRWCNDGALPSGKTEGGHRRIRLDDAQAFARAQAIDTVLTPFHPYEPHVYAALRQVTDTGSFTRFHSLAMGWIHRGRHRRLADLLRTVATLPGVAFPRFCDEALRGLMLEVGRAWHEGRLRAGEEHMVTQVVVDVLVDLRRRWKEEREAAPGTNGAARPAAVVGATEGNQHHLGALCIRLLLERRGWDVLYLGPDVPVEDFGAIQTSRKADLVCISLTPPATAGEVARIVRVLSGFYDPAVPYALALGGSLGGEDAPAMAEDGPFRSLAVFHSCASLVEALDRAASRR